MSLASALSAYLPSILKSSSADFTQSLHKDIRIKRLRVHPIKSCRGLDVNSVVYDNSGFQYDRTWLIISAETLKFYTARDLPKLVLIEPRVDQSSGTLFIKVPSLEKELTTPLDPTLDQLATYPLISDITIWGDKIDGYAVSQDADEALSAYLGKPVRLVRKGPSLRPSGPHEPAGPLGYAAEQKSVNMQDFYPILVATEASFAHVRDTLLKSVYPDRSHSTDVTSYKVPDNLNRGYWTPETISTLGIERFRPNIIVGDAPSSSTPSLTAFEEDTWASLEVLPSSAGEAGFGEEVEGKGKGIYTLVRCGRCMVPNIDPATGIRDAFLPYRVIIQSRKVDTTIEKPCFGMLSCTREDHGTLKVGDVVRVTKTVDPDVRKIDLDAE